MIKIVLHCTASSGSKDPHYGDRGCLYFEYKKMADTEVQLHGFGGFIDGNEKEKFLEACANADIIIIDAWNHPPDDSWIHSSNHDPYKSMANIAKEIKKVNPFAHLFADLMEGIREVEVHKYARPINHWVDKKAMQIAFESAKKKAKIKEKGDEMKKLLIVDDDKANQQMAQEQFLGRYDLAVASSFSEAKDIIMNNDIDIDIIMTDIMMPGEDAGQGASGMEYVGELIPVGLVIALLAIQSNIPEIFIVSDTGHHDHPIIWAMDSLRNGNKIKCIYRAKQVGEEWIKDWKTVLEEK